MHMDYTTVISTDREHAALVVIFAACSGEPDLAILLAKRAANQGMRPSSLRGLSRDALIERILMKKEAK